MKRFVPNTSRAATLAAVTALFAGTIATATPARADPVDDPCQLALTVLCHFMPMAPDLDHDIDLTQNQPPGDPAAPPPESIPISKPCAAGCI
jgi:hypothetical protein